MSPDDNRTKRGPGRVAANQQNFNAVERSITMTNELNETNVNETAVVAASPEVGNEIVANFANTSNAMWASFNPETADEKALLFNAMNAPDVRIADHIGQVINVRDVVVEPVEIVDEKTGEIRKSPRVILIDTDGHTYSATSYGIYNALRRLSAIYGLPTWEGGIPVRVKQIARGANRIFTLDVVRK